MGVTRNLHRELYKIFKRDRSKLPEFLLKYGSYDHLTNLLKTVEIRKSKYTNIIMDMFLGNIGYETNKQSAIYELPTKELIDTILHICQKLNIKTIEELCAGQGLLSRMLNETNKVNVVATDGNRWIETSFPNRYFNVTSKYFIEYCTDFQDGDKLLILSWPPDNDNDALLEFIEKKKPNNILVLGSYFYDPIKDIVDMAQNKEYNVIDIPAKQICLEDYYKHNNFFPNCCCRSHSILLTRSNVDVLKDIDENNLCKSLLETKYSDKLIFQDFVKYKLELPWVFNLTENKDTYIDIVIYIAMVIQKKLKPPLYIKNLDEFNFWYNKVINKKFPLKIESRQKFKEFKKIMHILEKNQGLSKIRSFYGLPSWITNLTFAEQYIWLDFSTTNKKWKESLASFSLQFDTLFTRNIQFESLSPRNI